MLIENEATKEVNILKQYQITGMSCATCAARVEQAVQKIDGITSCSVNLLTNSMRVEGFASSEQIAPNYNIVLDEWNHDKDHVHILFRGQPNTEISKFINAYKSASSRFVKKEFPQIRKSLWNEMFWSQSYCLITTGGVTAEVIREYIQSQGVKHGKQSNQVSNLSDK